MPILPIDTGRYGTAGMLRIFREETKIQRMLDVEAALASVLGELGEIPKEDAKIITEKASTKHVRIERVKEIEHEINHEVMSLVVALAEACGPSGAYVHLGATSSDIADTATTLQLRDAISIIERRLDEIELALLRGAERYKDTIMMGRTHGQHALPITLGFKLTVWMREFSRHIQRLRELKGRLLVGKMGGAVGTQAGFGSNAIRMQEFVMRRLGLKASEISTQILQRDRHAEFMCLLAIVGSSLGNIATEIRELQRTEIAEVHEPLETNKQVGSSTMPHKRNPELCERVCGLAKIARSLVIPALENIPTWHERDLTQSSSERFIIPEACIIVDYMLYLMVGILGDLDVDEKRMWQNMGLTEGRMMSEAVMISLTKKGMDRREAYELLRQLTAKSKSKHVPLKEVLLGNPEVVSRVSSNEIDTALDARNYLGTATEQIRLCIERTKNERKYRGVD